MKSNNMISFRLTIKRFTKTISSLTQWYKRIPIATKASIWAFVAVMIQRGTSILTTPIFTRILTTDQYAQFTLYQSWSDLFMIFASLHVFNYAIYSGLKEYEKDVDGFISTSQLMVTGLSLVTFFVYYIITLFAGDFTGFSLPIIILMFFDILFFSAFNIWAAKERYFFRYRLMTILSVAIGVLGPFLGFIATFLVPEKGYGRIYGIAFVNIAFGLVLYLYSIFKARKKFNPKYLKYLLAFCLPLLPHFLASNVLTRFDRIMIDNMCSTAEAGIYALAYSLSSLLLIVNDSILKGLVPWTYNIISKGRNLAALKRNATILSLLVAVANLILILFAPEVLRIFASEEYYQAVYIIPAVSASVFFTFLFNLFVNIEYYYSETKFVTIASVLAAVTNIALNLIFIPIFGFIAAGYTTLIGYILLSIGHYFLMRRVCLKKADARHYYNARALFTIAIVFTLVSLAIIPLYQFLTIRYIIIGAIFIILIINRKRIIKTIKQTEKING